MPLLTIILLAGNVIIGTDTLGIESRGLNAFKAPLYEILVAANDYNPDNPSEPGVTPGSGDINKDNIVDQKDIDIAIKLIINKGYNKDADTNGDSKITIKDLVCIIRRAKK